MADPDLQEALRTARAGDGQAWLRLAAAQARRQAWDVAGMALLEASWSGAPTGEAAAALEPDDVDAFVGDVLPGPGAAALDWGPDGALLYFADRRALWSVAPRPGGGRTAALRQRVAALPGAIVALAATPAPAALVLGLVGDDGGLAGCHAAAMLDLATERLRQSGWVRGRPPRGGLAWDRATGAAVWGDVERVDAVHLDQEPVDPARAWGRRRIVWSGPRGPAAVDRSGWVAVLGRGTVSSWRTGDAEPRLVLAHAPVSPRAVLHAAGGDRAVVCAADSARLHGAQGELGRALLPLRDAYWSATASPSGRFLALLLRDEALLLLDLLADRRRRILLPGRPQAAAWSPSGRRLAVSAGGRLVVIGVE